jgi:hypothetical protein
MTSHVAVYMKSEGFVGESKVAKVQVLLDSNIPVNAYEIALSIDSKLLMIDRIDTSNSIIKILQEPISASDDTIIIRGGSAPAFTGSSGEIMTIYFRAKAVGQADLNFKRASIFQADGKGTPAIVSTSNATLETSQSNLITVKEAVGELQQEPEIIDFQAGDIALDTSAPEIMEMRIVKNPFDNNTKLLVFSSKDNISSVIASRVRTRTWLSWSVWQEATNPYPLQKDAWAVELQVIDGSGNISSKTIYAWTLNFLIYLIGLIIVIIFVVWISRRRKQL